MVGRRSRSIAGFASTASASKLGATSQCSAALSRIAVRGVLNTPIRKVCVHIFAIRSTVGKNTTAWAVRGQVAVMTRRRESGR